MSSLTIPERYRPGVARLGTISDSSFLDLLEALRNSDQSETARELASKIQGSVPSITASDRESIIAAIASMQSVQKAAHVDVIQFASDVWASLEEDSPELISEVEADTLKSRVAALLNQTSVHLTSAKVAELRSEVERLFCGARILTDVRTAFPDDASRRPAMSILQTLEIKYHDDLGRHREFYVALDDTDLAILKDAVERAVQKKASLVDMLRQADFELFE